MRPPKLVPITLDRPRRLLFDFNALAAAEEAAGCSLLSLDLAGRLSARILRALVWAALLHEDRDLTLEQVGAWLHPGNLRDIAEAVEAAFQAALPDQDPTAPSREEPLSTGNGSGPQPG
jgi:hypothetical protein